MPQIPTYESRAAFPTERLPLIPENAGAVLNRQMEVSGAQIQNTAGNFVTKIRESEDLDFVLNSQIAASKAWSEYQPQAEQAAPAGAKGFTQQTEQWWQSQVDSLLEGAPSERAKAHAKRYLAPLVEQGIRQAAKFEANSRLKYYSGNVDNYLTEVSRQAYRDPSLLDYNISLAEGAIDAGTHPQTGWWPASIKDELKTKARETVAQSAFLGITERDPNTALTEIKSGKWDQYFGADTLHTLTQRAERDANHFNSTKRVLLQERIKSALTEMEATGNAPEGIVSEVAALYGPEHAQVFSNQLQSAGNLYNVGQEIAWLPPEQAALKVQALAPLRNDSDFDNRYHAYVKADRMRQELQQHYAKDPVSYVMSSPTVKRASESERLDSILHRHNLPGHES